MKTDSLAIIQKLTEDHKILNDSIQELHNQNLLENLDLIRNMTTFYDSAWLKLVSFITLVGILIPLYFGYLTKKRNDELRIKLEEDIKRNEAYSIKRNQEIFSKLNQDYIQLDKRIQKNNNKIKQKLQKGIEQTTLESKQNLEAKINVQSEKFKKDHEHLINELQITFKDQDHKVNASVLFLQGLSFFNLKSYSQSMFSFFLSIDEWIELGFIDKCLITLNQMLEVVKETDDSEKRIALQMLNHKKINLFNKSDYWLSLLNEDDSESSSQFKAKINILKGHFTNIGFDN